MQAILTKNLFRRTQATNEVDAHGHLDKGSVIDVVSIEEGKLIDGISTWYKATDGFFYWGGGIEVRDTLILGISPSQVLYPWWIKNTLYSIPDLWENQSESKITIAILDTGINEHIDFDFNKINGFNYLDNSINYKTDIFGHGTHLAGIMIAKGKKSYGIIPSANLFVAKVCDNRGIPIFSAIKQALDDILNEKNGANEIDVINMSFDLAVGNDPVQIQLKNDIEKLIKRIVSERKCICVAACGDDGLDTDDPFECFPASLEECISVGGLNEKLERDPISNKSVNLDIMAPCTDILSSNGTNAAIKMRGTSQSAAFVSSVCALGIQKLKNNNSFSGTLIKSVLYKTARSSVNQHVIEYGHGIINPNLFILSL